MSLFPFSDTHSQPGQHLVSYGLLGSCVDGDSRRRSCSRERAFAEVYREHRGYVSSCLRRFGIAASDLDDVTQEVFLIVYDRLDDFDRDRASIRSWLYGICRRKAANERRRGKRLDARMAKMPPKQQFITEAELRRREAGRLVDRFLQGLDRDRREVFAMIDVQGRSAPEVAQWLGVSVNTIYSRLRTARHRFADFLRGIESEGIVPDAS